MKGFIYRLGVKIREIGETRRNDIYIKIGLAITDFSRKLRIK